MRRIVLGVLIGLLALPSWATTEGIHSVLHVRSSDWVGVRFVRLSDFQPKTTVDCPCKCPCSEGKPCDCGDKCKCKDCPGKSKLRIDGYKNSRLEAIRNKVGVVVFVGMQPDRTYSNLIRAIEPLGWIDPWGNQINSPCKMEFYYQDGKIWLLEPTSYRAPVQRSFRAVSC